MTTELLLTLQTICKDLLIAIKNEQVIFILSVKIIHEFYLSSLVIGGIAQF